ncbi:MAG TPA: hypothetical protein VGS22_16140 [Thermoanaerobaculia bacterium]|nr:hypothetical protein [Thermoanaerobaculia bacterium]
MSDDPGGKITYDAIRRETPTTAADISTKPKKGRNRPSLMFPSRSNAPVQRRAAQRKVRCNRSLDVMCSRCPFNNRAHEPALEELGRRLERFTPFVGKLGEILRRSFQSRSYGCPLGVGRVIVSVMCGTIPHGVDQPEGVGEVGFNDIVSFAECHE